jgi:anaerobic dimethyl sulfoxide reductase subunit B (iron-sulfur subunit)
VKLAFYFNGARCTGCYACVVACKDWHDIPAGPVFLRRVVVTEQGDYPRVTVRFVSTACHHCDKPLCIAACPAGAISKRAEDGIVVVDAVRCLGRKTCGAACLVACPHDAPQFGTEPNPKMQKCDLCRDRWIEKKKPICVEACPMRALDAGDRDAVASQ